MIDLTPLDVRKKKGDFRRALRGYEPALVDDFLDIVADRLEELVREHAALTERGSRLEHQVAEYRDRERALTDALVTAQAMREEITERTTREAAAVRLTAQQEAETQLKDAVQQADSTVRDAEQRAQDQLRRAQEEAETRVQRAQQEASARLREAEEEATARLRAAEQEAERLRAATERTRAEEEDALRQLRSRQQELVTSYRTFLQRELVELNAMAASLQPDAAGPASAASPLPHADTAAMAADSPPSVAAASPAAETVLSDPDQAETEPPPTPARTAAPEPPSAVAVAPFAPDAFAAVLPSNDEEEEPFAPEPVYDEDLAEDERITRIEPVDLLRLDSTEVSEESGEAVEESWPDLDILPEGQEPDFSRPQPNPEALQLPWPDEPAAGVADADDGAEAVEESDEDPETETLLQNAARAGYSLDLDDEAELLLDEPATGEGDGDDWLDSIIEDDR